jgi:predicted TIM-barrel fold metal-dependent hydrolase
MSASEPVAQRLVDCDVHAVPAGDGLANYLPQEWVEHHRMFRGYAFGGMYPRASKYGARVDSWPANGNPPGSDLGLMREQLLDLFDIEYGILNPPDTGYLQRNLDYAAAINAAVNRWTAAEWLDPEPRLRGSISIAAEDPPAAVAEIKRVAPDRRFVQIRFGSRTGQPMGQRKYWPIYQAAVEHGLPIGMHVGGFGGHPQTPSGWPSFYLEDHVSNAQNFQSQLISMVFEGVFERFPDLKVVLIEGGVAWVPSMAWRMDSAWERMGIEVPHVKRCPSEYVAENVWMTTQPIEEPPDSQDWAHLITSFPSLADRLMFATDYPHWDFDDPHESIRDVHFPKEPLPKVLSQNARDLYGL